MICGRCRKMVRLYAGTTMFPVVSSSPPAMRCPVPVSQLGPTRTTVFRGVEDVLSRERCDDWMCSSAAHEVIGDKPWIGTTTFQVVPPPLPTASCTEQESGCSEALMGEWSAKQFRSVKSSARKAAAQLEPERQKSLGATKGVSCLSADSDLRIVIPCAN